MGRSGTWGGVLYGMFCGGVAEVCFWLVGGVGGFERWGWRVSLGGGGIRGAYG